MFPKPNIVLRSILLLVPLVTIGFQVAISGEKGATVNRGLQLASAAPGTKRGHALIIGNSRYRFISPLSNPANDATDLAATLENLGFEVSLKIDATHRSMENEILLFGRKLRKGGVGLFYFAGHGIQVAGRNYLIPIDANVDSESDIKFEAVDAGRVLGKMEDAGNGINIIILDACRNNPFSSKFRSGNRGLAKMDAPAGSILAYSTAPGSVAADGEGRNGLYTSKLLKFIDEEGLSIEDFFKKVRIEVMEESGNSQVPWESSSLTANFYFINTGNVKITTREKSRSEDIGKSADILFWESVKDSKDAKQYQLYIDQFPDGTFVNLARLYIKKYGNHKIQIDRKQTEEKSSTTVKKDSLPVPNRLPMEKSGHLNIQEKTKKPIIDKQASGFEPVTGPNWEFSVLSVENTGKQRWKSSGPKLGKVYHIGIKEENLSFWRVKAEVKRKKNGIDFDSQWMKLIYRVYKGEQKSVEAVANIMNFMGKKVASTGNFKISFGRRKLSKPLDLDLLFLAPKNSSDIKYMHLQFLDYAKVRVIPK